MATPTPKAKTRTYYGEYTLKHWIDLILSKSIILPEYQRSFAWKEEKIDQFIASLQKGDYIPPVTIAAGKEGKMDVNLILDGQQRLTSILLAALEHMPVARNFPLEKSLSEESISGHDLEDEEDEDDEPEISRDATIAWSFRIMLKESDNKDRKAVKETLAQDDRYKKKTFLALNLSLIHI